MRVISSGWSRRGENAFQKPNSGRLVIRADALNATTPGPPFVKIGRTVRYLKEDLDTWLEQFRQYPGGSIYEELEPEKPKVSATTPMR